MPTAYPGGFDDFTVTTLPEDTPLSQAGPGATRNHPELHTDEGDAIEALQHNAALKGHDHSGDAGDITKGVKLAVANTHENANTDTAGSIHRTVGTGHEQAARGDHHHDYNDGSIENTPWRICTSTTRPGAPYPGLIVYETDTDRVRAWGSFLQNTITDGLSGVENFTQTANSNNLGASNWEQWYKSGDTTHGKLAVPDGLNASWIDDSNTFNIGYARRINPDDMETESDDQTVSWTTGNTVIEDAHQAFANIPQPGASNDALLRMSDDHDSYIRVKVGTTAGNRDYVQVVYTTNGSNNEQELGTTYMYTNAAPVINWVAQIKDRTITVLKEGVIVATFIDSGAVTSKGADYRGWGMAMQCGSRYPVQLQGQVSPANVSQIRIRDQVIYTSDNRWTILPVANVPNCRLRQNINQGIQPSGTILQWGEVVEDQFGYFNLSNPTAITIKEPGLYQIEATIQWDPSVAPDTAVVVLCINGVETTIRQQGYQRGGAFTPGFSQTLALSGKLRFGPNDVLTLKASYTGSGGLLGFIFSFFDGPTKINSRIDISYLAP